jgi:hypothetical protein
VHGTKWGQQIQKLGRGFGRGPVSCVKQCALGVL